VRLPAGHPEPVLRLAYLWLTLIVIAIGVWHIFRVRETRIAAAAELRSDPRRSRAMSWCVEKYCDGVASAVLISLLPCSSTIARRFPIHQRS